MAEAPPATHPDAALVREHLEALRHQRRLASGTLKNYARDLALLLDVVGAPRIAECYANLECRVHDTRMVNRYGIFVLEVVGARVAASVKEPRTLHHRGYGTFMVAGETIRRG